MPEGGANRRDTLSSIVLRRDRMPARERYGEVSPNAGLVPSILLPLGPVDRTKQHLEQDGSCG